MADQLLPIVTTLASAVAGGALALIGVTLTNRSNERRHTRELEARDSATRGERLRARAEELYELVDTWLMGLAGYYLRRTSVMQAKMTYNECLDLDIEEGRRTPSNFGRIEMLIDVYFPETRAAYDSVIEARTAMNEIVTLHKHTYERGETDGHQFVDAFVQKQIAIEERGRILLSQIKEAIRGL